MTNAPHSKSHIAKRRAEQPHQATSPTCPSSISLYGAQKPVCRKCWKFFAITAPSSQLRLLLNFHYCSPQCFSRKILGPHKPQFHYGQLNSLERWSECWVSNFIVSVLLIGFGHGGAIPTVSFCLISKAKRQRFQTHLSVTMELLILAYLFDAVLLRLLPPQS